MLGRSAENNVQCGQDAQDAGNAKRNSDAAESEHSQEQCHEPAVAPGRRSGMESACMHAQSTEADQEYHGLGSSVHQGSEDQRTDHFRSVLQKDTDAVSQQECFIF